MTGQTQPISIPGFHNGNEAVNGVRLHFWLGGDSDGTPVVLWHGFLETSDAWRYVASALAKSGFSVLIPDMRGYGDSDKPEGTAGYDARSLANEARMLVRKLGFGSGRQIIHAAHDMGALPALIWTADHHNEVAGLLYIEAPVMLGDVLRKIIVYSPEAMKEGSMWWWILPFAPEVPERLIVGNERAFLTWFYDRHIINKKAITPVAVDEYVRTFSGREGVLGSLGIYRAAFQTIEQTEPLMKANIRTPVVAIGGVKGLGTKVAEMVRIVATDVKEIVLDNSGHFVPEEQPDVVVNEIVALKEHLSQTKLPKAV
jgi:pimeloyl-ACP methyl ester carboxylesterase